MAGRPAKAAALAVAIPVQDGKTGVPRGLEKAKALEAKQVTASAHIKEEPRTPSRRKVGTGETGSSSVYTPPDEGGARVYLDAQNWPHGLQSILLKSCEKYPIRYFIIDDSGSMNTNDGHRVVGDRLDARKQKMVKCTRWSELAACLHFHSELSHAAKAPTEFRFLNMAEPILVGNPSDQEGHGLDMFKRLIDEEGPGGQTPLCEQIRQVVSKISLIEEDLRSSGRKACVIVATDGEPTDGDLVEAMRPLQQLPCWLVIRVCTDEEEIIKYWNNIDGELEIEMDVLDDLAGEAEEIRAVNPWLYYSESLHRLREFGSAMKELDLIDESLLSSEQMASVCSALLCGPSDQRLPLPEIDFAEFASQAKRLMSQRPLVFDPILKSPAPVLNMGQLSAKYDQNPSKSCVIV